ncbi:MAG: hypothetical protein Q8N84_01825 [bacterium]|nr:hypothetical protein [bacterium]
MKKVVLIFSIYLVLASLLTYPLLFKLGSGVYGYPGDNFGFIWHLWWQKFSPQHNLQFSPTPMVGAPYGTPLTSLPSEAGLSYPLIWLTTIFNETVAFNVLVFLSFPLAGITLYLLAHYLTRNKIASFISGLIYAFCPFHFWQIYAHLSLGSIQWLPLFVWGLLYFEEVRSQQSTSRRLVKAAVLLGLSWVLVTSFSLYYGYFALLFLLAFYLAKVVWAAVWARPIRLSFPRSWWAFTLVLLVAMVAGLPFLYPMIKSQSGKKEAGQSMARPIEDMLSLSARPWDFVLPAPDHPLLGKWSDSVYAKIRGLTNDYKTISAFLPERVLFVGWLPLVLGMIGMIGGIRGMKEGRFRQPAFLFAFCLLILTFFSAPPFVYIKGHRLFFPSYFFYQILPMFRVYTRLGGLIELLLSVLAGFGIVFIFERLGEKKTIKIIIICLFSLVLIGEFLGIPPYHFTSTAIPPESYQWVAKQSGDFIIADYPKAYDTQDAMFWQRLHGKRIFNTLGEPDYYKVWTKIEHLYYPEAPQILANLGVKYVVWHYADPVYQGFNPVDETRWQKFKEPEIKTDIDGLKIVAKLSDAYVYEVMAKPTMTAEKMREEIITWP